MNYARSTRCRLCDSKASCWVKWGFEHVFSLALSRKSAMGMARRQSVSRDWSGQQNVVYKDHENNIPFRIVPFRILYVIPQFFSTSTFRKIHIVDFLAFHIPCFIHHLPAACVAQWLACWHCDPHGRVQIPLSPFLNFFLSWTFFKFYFRQCSWN